MRRAVQIANTTSRQVETRFTAMNRNMSHALNSLGLSFSGISRRFGFSFGVADIQRLGRAITQIGSQAENLVNVADRLGITTKALQELRHAAEVTDLGVEGLDDILDQFAKRVGDAASGTGELKGVLEANNIAIRNGAGAMRPLLDIFGDYVDLIKNSTDATRRADLATAGFGRGTREAINFAMVGREGLQAFADAANRLGKVLDDTMLRRMADVNDEWQLFTSIVSTEFQSTIMSIVTGFTEGAGSVADFQSVIHDLFQFIRDNQHWLDNLVGALAGLKVGRAFGPLGAAIGAAAGAVAPDAFQGGGGAGAAANAARVTEIAQERITRKMLELGEQIEGVEQALAQANKELGFFQSGGSQFGQNVPAAIMENATEKVTALRGELDGALKALNDLMAGVAGSPDGGAAGVSARGLGALPGETVLSPAPGGSNRRLDFAVQRSGRPIDANNSVPVTVVGPSGAIASGEPGLSSFLRAGQASSHISQLSGDFAEALSQMFRAAPAAVQGATTINSGFRSFQRQAELFDAAVRKYGSEAEARKWVAPPGRSFHNRGQAADLGFQSEEARRWFHQNAGRFGLDFPMGHEPWHIEQAGVRGQQTDDDFQEQYEARIALRQRDAEAAKTQQEAIEGVFGALAQQTAAQELDTASLGRSTFERERAIAVQQLENELRSAGVTNIEAYREQIDQLATAYARSTEAAQLAADAAQNMQASMGEIQSALGGALKGFIHDLIAGKSATEALGNALGRLGERLIDMALDNILGSIFGGGGGGIGGGIIGALFGGGRQHGGPVNPGQVYRVGETGPEMFAPKVPGVILPANRNQPQGAPARVEILVRRGELFEPEVVRISGRVSAVVSQEQIGNTQDRQRRRG